MKNTVKFVRLQYVQPTEEQLIHNAQQFYDCIRTRRSVRSFSPQPVPQQVIENCLRAAGSAPSGANRQPWHFVVVGDPVTKRKIRKAAEEEEKAFYDSRAPSEWLEALAPLGTDAEKPFLEQAPYLIVIFAESHGTGRDSKTVKNYYVQESVGIATGLLISAIHSAGLASLTHTPSPMNFLNRILDRPANERPFLILVVGYPSRDCMVPDIKRKPLSGIATFIKGD